MTQALEHLTTNRGLVTGGSVVHIPVFLPGDEPDAPMPIPGPAGPAGANGATGATGAPGPPGPALAGEPGEDGAMIFIPTGGSGTAVLDINGLTTTDVALDDTIPEYDTSATGNRKLSVDRLAGFSDPCLCDFRLSTESGVPVSNSDRTAQGTIYMVPVEQLIGVSLTGLGRIALFDTTRWRLYTNAQVSLALSFSTHATPTGNTTNGSAVITTMSSTAGLYAGEPVSGAGIPVGARILSVDSGTQITLTKAATITGTTVALTIQHSTYDVFVKDLAGTLTMSLQQWTNTSTRGTALSLQDGVLVLSSDTAKRYLGTVQADGISTTADSRQQRFLWPMNHRVPRAVRVQESTSSWSYTTATWRYANNSSANRVEVVIGLPEVLVSLESTLITEVASAVYRRTGIGKDTNTANSADLTAPTAVGGSVSVPTVAWLKDMPALGYHYYAWVEMGGAGVTQYGNAGAADQYQSGLIGWLMG